MGPLSFEQRVRRGEAYTVTTPKLTAGLLTNIRATIQNPSNSTKQIFIYCLEASVGSGSMFFGTFFKNPDANIPTTALTPANQNLSSSNASVAVVKADLSNSAMTAGGGSTLFTLGIQGSARIPYKEQLLVIPPNMTIGVNIPILLVTDTVFKLDFWEE